MMNINDAERILDIEARQQQIIKILIEKGIIEKEKKEYAPKEKT